MYNLGYCYKKGHGIQRDHKLAIAMFRKAAAQGDAKAISLLSQHKLRVEPVTTVDGDSPLTSLEHSQTAANESDITIVSPELTRSSDFSVDNYNTQVMGTVSSAVNGTPSKGSNKFINTYAVSHSCRCRCNLALTLGDTQGIDFQSLLGFNFGIPT